MPKASQDILSKFRENISFLGNEYTLEDVIIYKTGWESSDDNYKSLLPIYSSETKDRIIFKPINDNQAEFEISHWLANNKSLEHKLFENNGVNMKTAPIKIENSSEIILNNEDQENYSTYIALPYVGKSLETRLKETSSPDEFKFLVKSYIQLIYDHYATAIEQDGQKLLHGDISLGNILVSDKNSQLYFCDFGILNIDKFEHESIKYLNNSIINIIDIKGIDFDSLRSEIVKVLDDLSSKIENDIKSLSEYIFINQSEFKPIASILYKPEVKDDHFVFKNNIKNRSGNFGPNF